MRLTPWIGAAAVAVAATHASAQLRVVSYNLLDKPKQLTDATVVGNLNTVFGAIAGYDANGIARRPDIIFASEQTTASPGNLATILNNLYGVTSYAAVTPTSPTPQGINDRLAFVYDTSSVTLSSTPTALPITSTYPRPTIRAGFRPVGYSSADADLYVYGLHLKASSASSDAAERANQTLATRADADALPAGANAIYAGDFNVYTANEQGYRNLFAPGNGQAADPINASFLPNGTPIAWSNNAAYASIHTQSTRTTSLSDGGATGGVDDRFDFQLVTGGMLDGDGISYIGPTSRDSGARHSYVAFGNNGSTFNRAINDPLNTAQPANVLEALFRTSDHLPVVADYQLPAKMSVTTGPLAGAVIQGASVHLDVSVTNSAPVANPLGADALEFTVSATNTQGGTQGGSIRATQGAAVASFAVDTSTPGARQVQVSVNSTSQGVADGNFTRAMPVTVYAPAQPSLSGNGVQAQGTLDLGIVAIGTTLAGSFDVFNLPGTFTAGLDLDSANLAGDGAFAVTFTPQANIAPGTSAPVALTFSPGASRPETSTLSILTSDVDLPGAQARSTLSIDLVARGAFAGDTDLSDSVDFNDLLVVAQHFDALDANWFTGDFNRDHLVNFEDLLALSQNYGLNALSGSGGSNFGADWALARSIVPEPASCLALGGLALLTRCRRA